MVAAIHNIVLGLCEDPGCTPIGLRHGTRPKGQNIDSGRQIVLMISIDFG
jgi:hypothetical protein